MARSSAVGTSCPHWPTASDRACSCVGAPGFSLASTPKPLDFLLREPVNSSLFPSRQFKLDLQSFGLIQSFSEFGVITPLVIQQKLKLLRNVPEPPMASEVPSLRVEAICNGKAKEPQRPGKLSTLTSCRLAPVQRPGTPATPSPLSPRSPQAQPVAAAARAGGDAQGPTVAACCHVVSELCILSISREQIVEPFT